MEIINLSDIFFFFSQMWLAAIKKSIEYVFLVKHGLKK